MRTETTTAALARRAIRRRRGTAIAAFLVVAVHTVAQLEYSARPVNPGSAVMMFTGLALLLGFVLVISRLAPVSALENHTGQRLRYWHAPGMAVFVVALIAGIWAGLSVNEHARAAQPHTTAHATVTECTHHRSGTVCDGHWTVGGEWYEGDVPYRGDPPEEGDDVPIKVITTSPEIVVSESHPWFVRYGVWAALLAVAVLCVRWYRKAIGLTRQLHALGTDPAAAEATSHLGG